MSLMIAVLVLVSLQADRGTAAEPADPHANPKARAILNYLESLPETSEKRLASGQFAGFGSGASLRACEEAYKKTGHWPAIIGLDYAEFRTGGLEWKSVNKLAIDYAQQGGWSPSAPTSTTRRTRKRGGLRDKGVDLETLLTPGHENSPPLDGGARHPGRGPEGPAGCPAWWCSGGRFTR